MTVKVQHEIRLDNFCGCLVDTGLLIAAMEWYAGRPFCGKKRIFMHGKYPAVSLFGKKIHVHRLLGLFQSKEVLVSGLVVHHKDENRMNALLDNLEIQLSKDHASLHNTGKVLSEQHKRKISEANRKRKGVKVKRKYDIPIEELAKMIKSGMSVNKIAAHYGCDWSVVKSRIYEHPELLEAP
jgi:hypothetical protein